MVGPPLRLCFDSLLVPRAQARHLAEISRMKMCVESAARHRADFTVPAANPALRATAVANRIDRTVRPAPPPLGQELRGIVVFIGRPVFNRSFRDASTPEWFRRSGFATG